MMAGVTKGIFKNEQFGQQKQSFDIIKYLLILNLLTDLFLLIILTNLEIRNGTTLAPLFAMGIQIVYN